MKLSSQPPRTLSRLSDSGTFLIVWHLESRKSISKWRTQVKKTLVICSALLVLASVSALAEDGRTITINGGRTTVQMRPVQRAHGVNGAACVGFYDNICGGGYQTGTSWTVSDGSPLGYEDTPANQIVSVKSGTTKKISVGLSFVTGTNGAFVDMDKDCSNLPCGNPDGSKHLCQGKVKDIPNLGSTSTKVVSIKCVAKLTKGKPYWVFIQSEANSWEGWNYSNSATGGFVEGTNDTWGSYYSGQPVGALTIK